MAWIAAAIGAVGSVASAKIKANGSAIGMGHGVGMNTDARSVENIFDNSGWNVSFGSSKIDSTASKTTSQAGAVVPNSVSQSQGDPLAGLGNSLGQSVASIDPVLIYAGVGVLALMALKKRK